MRPARFIVFCSLVAAFAALILGSWRVGAQPGNPIQLENQNPGSSGWNLSNPGYNGEIEGYASATSVNAGGQISFFVNAQLDSSYTLTIYRMGYYQGLGGRQMTSPVTLPGTVQVVPSPDSFGMVECNWTNPYVFTVPSNWVSGIYLVSLTGIQSTKQGSIIFVVRNDGRTSDFLFQSSVNTYQAYNNFGGKSLYGYNSTSSQPAVKVSFNRPYADEYGAGELFRWELDAIAFLESQGYDLSYSTDLDTHENGAELLNHKGYLAIGHDEYWSYEMRQNVQNARDHGVNLAFIGANDCFWQVRLETSPATGAADRTLVAYKDNWQQDPAASNPATYYLVTTNWRGAHVTLPGTPEDEMIGVMYNGFEPTDSDIVITNPSYWVFAGTGLKAGNKLTGLLGYEVDEAFSDSPSGTIVLAHSPYTLSGATQFSDMSIYQASSGAWVWATGSMQWTWGLSNLAGAWGAPSSRVNPAAQQITRNVLGRFVSASTATPGPTPSPIPGGVTASRTVTPTPTPTASSTVQINSPANGATVSGSVSIVAQAASNVLWINIYIDGGYLASGPPYTFTWDSTKVANGSHVISARAYNSSNQQIGSTAVTVTVQNGTSLTPTLTPSTPAATPTAPNATPTASTPNGTVTPPGPTATPTASSAVQIDSPTDGATVSGNVTITAQASSSVLWINIYIDGGYLASGPPYTFTWNSTKVANGSHVISARAYNSSNQQIGSAAITVTVQNGRHG